MKTTFILICALLMPVIAAAASQSSKYGFVAQALGATESSANQMQSSVSATERGWFGSMRKAVVSADWDRFATESKRTILLELASAGWKVDFDMGAQPIAGSDFHVMISASKGSDQLHIRAVIFLEKNGEVDIAFFEQEVSKT